MKRKWLVSLSSFAGVALLYAAITGDKSIQDIPSGTGYAALDLCSRTMLSAEPAAQMSTRYIEPNVAPLPLFWNVDLAPT